MPNPVDNRLIFTEHTSYASKPLENKRVIESKVSRNNIDYLTTKKTTGSEKLGKVIENSKVAPKKMKKTDSKF